MAKGRAENANRRAATSNGQRLFSYHYPTRVRANHIIRSAQLICNRELFRGQLREIKMHSDDGLSVSIGRQRHLLGNLSVQLIDQIIAIFHTYTFGPTG